MTGSLLAHVLLLAAFQDSAPSATAVRLLAMRGAQAPLDAAVRLSPAAAREALFQLMTLSAEAPAPDPALSASERLAGALARATGDSFPVREMARFAASTPSQRREKVTVDSLRRAGNTQLHRRGFSAAQGLWRESIRRAQVLGDTAGMAAATGNLGAGWYAEPQLDSAALYFERAAALARSANDPRTMLNAMGGMANVLRDRGELARARALYDETSHLRERIGDARGVIADQINSGILAEQLGDLAGAQRAYAAAVERSRLGGFDESGAAAHVDLAQLASLRGDFVGAGAGYDSALAMYRRLGFRVDEALVLRGLGLMELRRGEYDRAEERLTAAANIYRVTGPPASRVAVMADLAALSAMSGQPEEARVRVEAASAAARAARDGGATDARVALARADLEAAFNRRAVAETWYRRSETQYRRVGDGQGEARARAGRGYLLLVDEDYAGAALLLAQVARSEEQFGDQRSAALTRIDLAAALDGAGQPERARALARTARDTLSRMGDAPGEAAAMNQLAELEMHAGRPAAAEALYRDALRLVPSQAAAGVRWSLELGLASSLEEQGAGALAKAVLEEAIAGVERSGADLATDRRAAFFSDKWQLYSSLAALEAAAGHDSAAFSAGERLHARELAGQLGRGRISWRAAGDSTLVGREQDLRRTITQLTVALDASPSRGGALLRGPDVRAQSSAAEREALEEAEGRYAALLEEIREQAPAYAAAVRPRTVTWHDVASRLPPDAAMLEYLVADSSVLLFVITPEQLRTLDLHVERRALASLVDFVRASLARLPAPGMADPAPAALQRLHALLVQPAIDAGLLDQARRLLIVPHGELHYLPFAALREPGPTGRALVERYDVALVPSAGSWVELEQRPVPAGQGVLAVAPASARLPGTVAEVNGIRAAYGSSVRLLVGEAATRTEILRQAPAVSVLHIASYGVLNRRNPLFSYVELAPTGTLDGRLEVHDVYGLALDARLVVLSACQTGVGSGLLADVPAGDEWVSLSRAFLVAGARRVLASLWVVDDKATADLMNLFYGQLVQGATPSAALGAAQRAIRAQKGRENPFYWAGFEVMGGF